MEARLSVLVPLFMATSVLLLIIGLGIGAALLLWLMATIADKLTRHYVCNECGDEVSEFDAINQPGSEGEKEVWYCPECSVEVDG